MIWHQYKNTAPMQHLHFSGNDHAKRAAQRQRAARLAQTRSALQAKCGFAAAMLMGLALLSGCLPLSPVAVPAQPRSGAVSTPAPEDVAAPEDAPAPEDVPLVVDAPTTAESAPAAPVAEPVAEPAEASTGESSAAAAVPLAPTEAQPDTSVEEVMTEEPTTEDAVVESQVEEAPDPIGLPIAVDFRFVHFTYDSTIARNWTVEYLVNPPPSDAAPSFYTGPSRQVFRFSHYPAPLGSIEPVIYVYEVANISDRNEYKVANQLGALLAQKTPLHNYKTLPFLPLIDERQALIGQPKSIQFQSGSGIRYLTIMQDSSQPFLYDSVWYTFQGLTSDNKFYIAAVFPLGADMFSSELGDDYSPEAFAARHDEYLLLSKAALNLAPRTAFTPRLSRLDALVESIEITDDGQTGDGQTGDGQAVDGQ